MPGPLEQERNAYGSAYRLSHSLIALGRTMAGRGPGASVEKLHYLPEAPFLMAVVGMGFAGVMLVITLFTIIIYRGFDIGRQAIINGTHVAGLVRMAATMWFGDAVVHQHGRVPGSVANEAFAADELWRIG